MMTGPQYRQFALGFLNVTPLSALVFCGGCGLVSVLGTPTRHEKKIPAEYNLAKHADQKILVLVSQPAWLDSRVNLRYHVTGRLNEELAKKVDIPPEHLVTYDELSKFRSNQSRFSRLSPTEIGTALDANLVLLVMINGYELSAMPDTSYFKGFLSAEAALRDVATGKKLWPEAGASKSVRVGFDVESYGLYVAVERLASALAHCTVRYLYDCSKENFKIADDRSDINWEK